MALTPPTVIDLETFRNEDYPPAEEPFVISVLQSATDAMWVFTGIETEPTDPRTARILKNAIMDLTLWLMTQYDHRDEINSPFSSERIGSYSYSKMQASSRGEDTGIWWLDFFFRLLRNPDQESSAGWVASERVFNPDGYTYAEQQAADKMKVRDPSEPWGF